MVQRFTVMGVLKERHDLAGRCVVLGLLLFGKLLEGFRRVVGVYDVAAILDFAREFILELRRVDAEVLSGTVLLKVANSCPPLSIVF
ncbi:MAG: hypothetical protein LWX55_15980 [Deltaproteobacteria bacterium]|nr:hypothetical protein [Deltaproteobacteria bacterium]